MLAVVLAHALVTLVSLAGVTAATLDAMTPGDPSSTRWRLVALQLLAAAVVTGLFAFDRVRHGDQRAALLAASSATLAASSATLAALGTWAAARMTGVASAFQLAILFCVATAVAAGWTHYRDIQIGGAAVWLAALLQAGAIFFLLALSRERRWPEAPLRAILLATPQWMAAWRFGSAPRLGRWDAGLATALGTGGITTLALITVMPISYVGFLGPALLQTPWGIAFYVGLGAGCWLFLRAGAALRRRLDAPRSDRRNAILAGILSVPALFTLAGLLGAVLP